MDQLCETPHRRRGEKWGQWIEVDVVKKSFGLFLAHCLFIRA